MEDLKLNIKFEVQALCKNINIKIEELTKTSLLHKLRAPVKDMRNPDFIYKPGAGGGGGAIQQPSPVATQPLPPPQPTQAPPAPLPPRPSTAEAGGETSGGGGMGGMSGGGLAVGLGAGGLGVSGAVIPPNPTPHPLPPLDIAIPPSLSHPSHRKLVSTAVERGIREIITGAVERSVSIALATTVHLVVKDLGRDPERYVALYKVYRICSMHANPAVRFLNCRMRSAASTMVNSLVTSLVHAICKEPLRMAISNHLRALLVPQLKDTVKDTAVIEQLIMQSAQDNIEVGVMCIEKISLERAAKDLDDALAREESGGGVGGGVNKLPPDLQELLRAPANISPAQLALYETFGKRNVAAAGSGLGGNGSGGASGGANAGAAGGVTHSQALEAYQVLYGRLEGALNKLHASYPGRELSLSMLGAGSEGGVAGGEGVGVINGIREILTITQRMPLHLRGEVAMLFCEGLFSKVMENIGGGGAASTHPDLLKIEVCVAILEGVRDACGGVAGVASGVSPKPFSPDILLWLSKYGGVTSNDEGCRKAYRHLLLVCVRAKLIRAPDLDRYLAHQMDGGKQLFYLEVALSCVKQCMMEGLGSVYDFPVSLDTVSKIRPTGMLLKKQLQRYLSDIKLLATAQEEGKLPIPNSAAAAAALQPSAPASVLGAIGGSVPSAGGAGAIGSAVVGGAVGSTPSTPVTTPPSSLYRVDPVFREQVTLLLDRFLRIHNALNDQVVNQIVTFLHQTGMLKTEEVCEKFFRVSVDVSVEACMKTITHASAPGAVGAAEGGVGTLNYTVIDALGRFFLLLIRLAEKDMLGIDMHLRSTLLSRILAAILRSLVEETESRKSAAQANPSQASALDTRPYYRILAYMSTDLGVPDPKSADTPPALLPTLTTYTQAYLSITPSTLPSFAFSWLQLVCKRSFLPHLLRTQKGWPLVHRLITSLLTFLAPFLQLAGMANGMGMLGLPDVIKKFYKGCLKVFLVLLHDFPEFLADYHLSLSDLIPLSCTQLRNVILSAFPRSMRLPDPATLSLSSLPSLLHSELHHTPRILTDYLTPLLPIKHHLDVYMASSSPLDLPAKLASALCTGGVGGVGGSGGVYNVSQMSALVVYVASVWVSGMQSGTIPLTASTPPPYELLKGVVRALDSEGRYTMLSVMANQLRYPNAHTHLFSHILLTLFADGVEGSDGGAADEGVQEQVTRVLLERLVVHRPHPVS